MSTDRRDFLTRGGGGLRFFSSDLTRFKAAFWGEKAAINYEGRPTFIAILTGKGDKTESWAEKPVRRLIASDPLILLENGFVF